MKKKLLMSIPMFALLFVSLVAASTVGFSLREADGEAWDVNLYSNGASGSGYLRGGNVGYSLSQTNGNWMARLQIERTRGVWFPVTVQYDSVSGMLNIPEIGVSADVVNLR